MVWQPALRDIPAVIITRLVINKIVVLLFDICPLSGLLIFCNVYIDLFI